MIHHKRNIIVGDDMIGENDLIDSYFTELKHEDEKYEKRNQRQ